MKKLLLKMVFLTISLSTFAQSDYAEIKGTVSYSNWRDTGLIKNALVKVKINDSVIVKVLTAEDGTYSLKLKKFKGPIELSIETSKKTVSSSKKRQCGFLASKDLRLIEDISKSDSYIVDFSVIPFNDCYPPPPSFYFKCNSLELFWNEEKPLSYDIPPDSAFLYIVSLLKENPEIVLEVSGHGDSKETKVDNLALKRAEFIKNKLVSFGINADRLQARAYGSTQMLVSDKMISKAKTKEEREALRQKNRRVLFKVLRFDFGK